MLRPGDGGEPVKALQDEPILTDPDEVFYMSAYHNLSASRSNGFGVGCIPVSEILSYCEFFHIDGEDERADLFFFISELDDEFIKYHADKDKKDKAKNKAKAKARRR